MKKAIILLLVIVTVALTLVTSGCKKTSNPGPILVGFHFHTYINDTLVDYQLYNGIGYTDSLGRKLRLSRAQFYVTNIGVHIYKGAWANIDSAIILKRIDNELYPLGYIPSSNYDSVRFTVGLGNTLNSLTPSAFSTSTGPDTVLSNNEAAVMWLSNMAGMSNMPTTTGYTFMNITGYDSTNALPLSYQIGGYGDTVNVVLAVPGGFNFNPNAGNGALNLIHIVADYGKLLQVLNPLNSGNTNSTFYGPNPTPAMLLQQNIKNIFMFECMPPINC